MSKWMVRMKSRSREKSGELVADSGPDTRSTGQGRIILLGQKAGARAQSTLVTEVAVTAEADRQSKGDGDLQMGWGGSRNRKQLTAHNNCSLPAEYIAHARVA